jgi:hypothetical protein
MFKFDDAGLYGKDAMDMLLKSYASATKGFQAIATETAEYSKKTYESNLAHMEKMMGVKSFEDAVQLNTTFAKTAIEGYLAELNKIGELYSDFAKQTYEPAQAAAAKSVEAVKSGAAKVATVAA